MIACAFNSGSGLGDMLHRYVTARTIANEKGYDFGVFHPQNFKGSSFMKLALPQADKYRIWHVWNEKDIRENGIDIRNYDPEINFIKDDTLIEGSFESFHYWGHNLDNINKWLQVESLQVPDDLCVLNFRGGEYTTDPNLFLGREYYDIGIAHMRKINPAMRFQVHTDDTKLARTLFPEFEVIINEPISHSLHSNMGINWRSLRYAKYAVIANSAFGIMPRILRHNMADHPITVAPRYWARRNIGVWCRPSCYYSEFQYV